MLVEKNSENNASTVVSFVKRCTFTVPVGCKSNSIFQAKSFRRVLIPVQDTKESDSLTSSEHFCEIKVVSVICLKKEEVEGDAHTIL